MIYMSPLYVPQKRIAVASSFEGVVNNGAKECAFVSFNAHQRMIEKGLRSAPFFGKILEPDEFKKVNDTAAVKGFLALRPFVADAEDYLTVIQLMQTDPAHVNMLVQPDAASFEAIKNNPLHGTKGRDPSELAMESAFRTDDGFASASISDLIEHAPRLLEAYQEYLIDQLRAEFIRLKQSSVRERADFKAEFYAERKRLQEANYTNWLSLQEPFPEAIEQLRLLAQNNFGLYYVTSKDGASTWQLCVVYTTSGALSPLEIFGIENPTEKDFEKLGSCIISKANIIGNERSKDKLVQMEIVAEMAGLPPSQVWRLNDRYDKGEAERLTKAGFPYFVVTGGYAFATDYTAARDAGIMVIERAELAAQLCQIARNWGF